MLRRAASSLLSLHAPSARCWAAAAHQSSAGWKAIAADREEQPGANSASFRFKAQQHAPMSTGLGPSPSSSASSSSPSSSLHTGGQEEGAPKHPPLSHDVHYEGPLSSTHRLLKMISISNTLIACAAAPLIVMYAEVSYVSRVGLASSLVFFGILTTGALHWIAHPYVHELKFKATNQQIDVRTKSLLGTNRWDTFQLDDVQPLPWDRPVATFMAKGRFYYIDVYSFPNEDLLKRLTPDESTVPKGHKDDEDDD